MDFSESEQVLVEIWLGKWKSEQVLVEICAVKWKSEQVLVEIWAVKFFWGKYTQKQLAVAWFALDGPDWMDEKLQRDFWQNYKKKFCPVP